MANLTVVPAEVTNFATAHTEAGGSVRTAANAPNPASSSMHTAYGPVGSAFTAAIDGFDAALLASGTALAADYDDLGASLHKTAESYTSTDAANGAQFDDARDPTIQLVSTPGARLGNQVEEPEMIVPPAGPGPNAGPRIPDSIVGTRKPLI